MLHLIHSSHKITSRRPYWQRYWTVFQCYLFAFCTPKFIGGFSSLVSIFSSLQITRFSSFWPWILSPICVFAPAPISPVFQSRCATVTCAKHHASRFIFFVSFLPAAFRATSGKTPSFFSYAPVCPQLSSIHPHRTSSSQSTYY